MLSDTSIRKLIAEGLVEPVPHDHQIQPASVDLLLGDIDTPTRLSNALGDLYQSSRWTILPGEFRLASTLETVTLPADIAGWVAGKSTLARLGLTTEQAGFVDPGFSGMITLELFNATREPIHLQREQAICQIAFIRLDQPAARPYGSDGLRSHYQHQQGPTAAMLS